MKHSPQRYKMYVSLIFHGLPITWNVLFLSLATFIDRAELSRRVRKYVTIRGNYNFTVRIKKRKRQGEI